MISKGHGCLWCVNVFVTLCSLVYEQNVAAQTKGPDDSCVGRCDDHYDKTMLCQCNKACEKKGDCCDNYQYRCRGADYSCYLRCGDDYDPANNCHCNSLCKNYTNCCNDYDAYCITSTNVITTTRPLRVPSEATAGAIVGGVAGAAAVVLICLLIIVILIFIRRKRTSSSRSKHRESEETGAKAGNDNSNDHANSYELEVAGTNDHDEYQEINDQPPEYAYAYVDGQRPITPNTESSKYAYAYAETNRGIRQPAPVAEGREAEDREVEEGWMDNTVYVSSGDGDENTRPTN
ncbi:uncharacterized protein [Amphiura filiformis]|uniref:uncharacterized protein n=1 Tax=Amphiura filiformis TaxID=82378 RepID=UPI003B212833